MGATHPTFCNPIHEAVVETINNLMEEHKHRLSNMSSRRRRIMKRRIFRFVRSRIPAWMMEANSCTGPEIRLTDQHLSNLQSLVRYAFTRSLQTRPRASVWARKIRGSQSDVRSARPLTAVLETETDSEQELEGLVGERVERKDSRCDARGVRFSTYTVTTRVEETQVNRLPICPICICDFELHDVAITLPCFHIFHKECVRSWLYSGDGCPMCRLAPLDLVRDGQEIIDPSTPVNRSNRITLLDRVRLDRRVTVL